MRTYSCLIALTLAALPAAGQHPGQSQSHADHMEHRFDNAEALSKRFDDPARDAWQMPDRVIQTLALKPGQVVADIGSGTGYFSVRLAKSAAAPKVYGVDIEPNMVKFLGERAAKEGLGNLVAVQGTAESPKLPEPADLVLIVDTYHHIGSRVAYFRKLRESLKPGGRVAIIDFRPDSPEGPPAEYRFPVDKFKDEMTQAGYTAAGQHNFLPRQHFLVFQTAAR